MLDVLKYIEKYAENHNIIDYSLKHRVLSLKDFNTPQSFAPGIGFFYNLKVYFRFTKYQVVQGHPQ